MGLFGFGDDDTTQQTQAEPVDESSLSAKAANALVGKLMDVGLDGLGPLDSVSEVVGDALKDVVG